MTESEVTSAAEVLQGYARSNWSGPQASLGEIPVFAAVVLGDVARAVRTWIEDLDDAATEEAGRELGNLILSSLRWIGDLGLDLTTCLESAARCQREYGAPDLGQSSVLP